MRAFWECAFMGFKSGMVYRFNQLMRVVSSVMSLLIQIAVWNALFYSNGGAPVADRTLEDLMTYTIISSITAILTSTKFAAQIEEKMKSGDIAFDFLRPQSPRLLFISQSMGSVLTSLLLVGVPVLLVSLFFVQHLLAPATVGHFLLFLLSIAGAFLISVALELLTGMMAFWFINVWLLSWVLDLFYNFFSGRLVPLWFFPDSLKNVAMLLPFQAAYFTPVEIYLGNYTFTQSAFAVCIQLIWAAGLLLLQQILWKRAVRRITVLGG